jgi:RNA polymerase sigma-70 factor, ECF subfamily
MEVAGSSMTSVDSRSDRVGSAAKVGVGSDADLVERAAGGDAHAFAEILAPRMERLFRIAVAIMRSEPDARDALQDASLRAWRGLPNLRDQERFDAWLTQIVVNACRSELQRRRVRQLRVSTLDALEGESGHLSRLPMTSLPDLGEIEVVRRAFDELDPATRALLILHYVEGLTLGEMSPVLKAPVGTLKWRLWRARRTLGRALEAQER